MCLIGGLIFTQCTMWRKKQVKKKKWIIFINQIIWKKCKMQARNLCKERIRDYTRMQVVTAYLPFSGTTVKFLFLVYFGNIKLNQKYGEVSIWDFCKYWWWWWCDDENMNIHFSTHLQKALVLSSDCGGGEVHANL